MHKELKIYGNVAERFSKRFLAIKLLEKDVEIERMVKRWGNYSRLMAVREKAINTIQDLLQTDSETAFTDVRYGFISGALRETYHENPMHKKDKTKLIDHIATSCLVFLCSFSSYGSCSKPLLSSENILKDGSTPG